jgi:hypothetical protein
VETIVVVYPDWKEERLVVPTLSVAEVLVEVLTVLVFPLSVYTDVVPLVDINAWKRLPVVRPVVSKFWTYDPPSVFREPVEERTV